MSFWMDVIARIRSTSDNCTAPFGVSREDRVLVYDDTSVSVDAPDEALIAFYTDTVGLKLDTSRVTSWKEIKKKSVRDSLLREYVFRNTPESSSSSSLELENQLSSFHLDIGIKKIQHDQITIGEDGLIETIFTTNQP